MRHEIEHDLDLDTAKAVARRAVESYATRFAGFDFKARWIRDDHVQLSFAVQGRVLDGTLAVEATRLVFTLDVPFLFRIFSGKATEIIERETQVWIDRARAGELGDSVESTVDPTG